MGQIAGILGVLTASALVATPAAAADNVTAFLFDAESGAGVVAVTHGATAELAFNLTGLSPKTRYTLVVSSKGCSSSKGTIIRRTFRTTADGVYWDPAPVLSSASAQSARVVRGGKTVLCAARPLPRTLRTDASKITNASPGVLVVGQGAQRWRVSMSLGGLSPQSAYRVVALEGGCSATAPILKRGAFRSDAKGAALVDLKTAAVAGKSISAVGVVQRSNGEVVFCKVL